MLIFILILGLKLSCGETPLDMTSLELDSRTFMGAEEEGSKTVFFASSDRGEYLSVNLDGGESTRVELPNGDWTFYALSWAEDRKVKCAVSSKKFLNGLSISIDLNLNNQNCLDPEFRAINSVDMGGESFFPELQIEEDSSSYKIKIYSMNNFMGLFVRNSSSAYETECLNKDDGPYKLNLPFLFARLPFHYVLEKFQGTDCDELIEEKDLPHDSSLLEFNQEENLFKLAY